MRRSPVHVVAAGACRTRVPRVRAASEAALRLRQGMPWGGPGSAPATPDPATLARLASQPGLWAPWEDAVTRALQRTHLELQRRAFWQRDERVVKSWAVVVHTAAGRQARLPPPRAAPCEADAPDAG